MHNFKDTKLNKLELASFSLQTLGTMVDSLIIIVPILFNFTYIIILKLQTLKNTKLKSKIIFHCFAILSHSEL